MADPDHERIWLEPGEGDPMEGRCWCEDDAWSPCDPPPTEYVRADLYKAARARIAELEVENARLRKALEPFAALANAADAWSAATGRPASGAIGHVSYSIAEDARLALASTRSRGDG